MKADTFQKAPAQVSFNTAINVPANGTQTVGGDCTPAPGANYFVMRTHTHRRGILATIKRLGDANEELVHTTNWDTRREPLGNAAVPDLPRREKFHYSCSYQNDRTLSRPWAPPRYNEMCMAITYFFPAMSGGSCN